VKYYIYAIHPENIKECLRRGLIAVKGRGKNTLKKVKPGEKFIIYGGHPEFKFIGYGIIKSKYYFNNKQIIWPDEKKEKRNIYPHKVKVNFLRKGVRVDIRREDILENLSFIENKQKYGAYLRNVFFSTPKSDYLFLEGKIKRFKKSDVNKELFFKRPIIKEPTTREIGNKFHNEILKLFSRFGFVIEESDYNKPGSDIVTSYEKKRVIIQCKKSTESGKVYPSLQSLIDEYSRKVQKRRAKVAILALGGYEIPKTIDVEEALLQDRVVVWNDRVINYYKNLERLIGKYAIYQLLGDLNVDARFDKKDRKLNFIEVAQNNYRFYLCQIDPEYLLKACLVKRRFNPKALKSYQRTLAPTRVKIGGEIPKYIDLEDSVFPTNIICVSRDKLNIEGRKLILPSKYGSLWIVDGQHRLYAFSNITKDEKLNDFKLPCALFDGAKLGEEKQGTIFIDINKNAKKVDMGLILELMPFLGKYERALSVVNRFDRSQMFKNKIRKYSDKRGTINLTTFVTNNAMKELVSDSGPILKKLHESLTKQLIKKEISKKDYRRETEDKCFKELRSYFGTINKYFDNEWNSKKYILATDKGIRALLKLLLKIYKSEYYKKDNGLEKIIKAFRKVMPKSKLKIEKFKRKYAGEAGAEELADEWSTKINNKLPDFDPEKAVKIIKDHLFQVGEKSKVTKFLSEEFNRLEGNVVGELMYIDETTFRFLRYLPRDRVKKIRLIIGKAKNPTQCQSELSKAKKDGYNITICKIEKEGYPPFHERWIGTKKYMVELNVDLKENALNKKHHKLEIL